MFVRKVSMWNNWFNLLLCFDNFANENTTCKVITRRLFVEYTRWKTLKVNMVFLFTRNPFKELRSFDWHKSQNCVNLSTLRRASFFSHSIFLCPFFSCLIFLFGSINLASYIINAKKNCVWSETHEFDWQGLTHG